MSLTGTHTILASPHINRWFHEHTRCIQEMSARFTKKDPHVRDGNPIQIMSPILEVPPMHILTLGFSSVCPE